MDYELLHSFEKIISSETHVCLIGMRNHETCTNHVPCIYQPCAMYQVLCHVTSSDR